MKEREALKLALEALEWFTAAEQGDEPQINKTITAIKEALAQPEQEPVGVVALIYGKKVGVIYDYSVHIDADLYTTPPQRKPLTDEERRETINRAWNDYLRGEGNDSFGWYLSQAIEAAHGIKENT